MYRGVTYLSLDDKGRFSIPVRYREEVLAECEGKLIITVDLDKCLLIYPFPQWESIERALMARPNMDRQVRALQRLLLGHATECEMSAQGRISVSPSLRRFAELDKEITLVGQGNKFELWNAALWQRNCDELLSEGGLENLSEALGSLSL
ncbi:MAG TPA: transcriptional regulator MraZ [Gammaproteobacteria bacterium]|nr:transcriptional regulator MraZ [Gammaproteobacteria bacterium]